jgi:hypothetical protein
VVIGYPQPRGQRWLPAAIGVVALAGLLSTLLPMWSMGLPSLRGSVVALWFGLGIGGFPKSESEIEIHVGFYDWIASGRPVVAVAPLVLALAIAVAVAAVLAGPDRTQWGATAAAAMCALIMLGATAIRPQSARDITGPLADQMSHRDAAMIQNSGQTDVHVGAGLVLALVALALVAGLAGWQYFSVSRQQSTGAP